MAYFWRWLTRKTPEQNVSNTHKRMKLNSILAASLSFEKAVWSGLVQRFSKE